MPEFLQTSLYKLLCGHLEVFNVEDIANEALNQDVPAAVSGLSGSCRAMLVAALWRKLRRPIIVLTNDEASSETLAGDLVFFQSQLNARPPESVCSFPDWGVDPYSGLTPHADTQQRRAKTLWLLRAHKADIVVASIRSIGCRLRHPTSFDAYDLKINLGDEISQELILEHLSNAGYLPSEPVGSIGEFSRRGGIVDVFSPLMDNPARIEFFGDRVDSIRTFDLENQRSLSPLRSVEILPMREHVVSREIFKVWAASARKKWPAKKYQYDLSEKLTFANDGELFPGSMFLLPGVDPLDASLIDYVANPFFVLDEPGLLTRSYRDFFEVLKERYIQTKSAGGLALAPEKLFVLPDSLNESLESQPCVNLEELGTNGKKLFVSGQPVRRFHGRMKQMVDAVRNSFVEGRQVVLLGSTVGMAERLREILHEYEVPCRADIDEKVERFVSDDKRAVVAIGRLSAGFRLPDANFEILAETDILDETEHFAPQRRRTKVSSFLSDLQDLKEGDCVVHMDHGIGVYGGVKNVHDRECMILTYQDGDRLYVPLERLDLVQKYSAAEGAKPNLDRLGGTSWINKKTRVKKAIRNMAAELLVLYAERKVAVGHAFMPDGEWQKEFEQAFQYEETPDQLTAITEIKKDMESEVPMDRLVCGDVGYGKTEVAMRAVFKAVSDNKQVAILSPTTVLCFQHYQTFRERFAAFPVRIGMLSRFVALKEQKQLVIEIESGKLDVVVGTHRLLSKDIAFQDLGLLIVDEEQRFGVKHKERLKELKKGVDVVTMTATPIPRTLHMGLTGLRDMSVIETPPQDRLAINTSVVKFDPVVIENAINFELERGGQVYFVHNEIESIASVANLLQRLCPKAKVGIGHGQMGEKELEGTMLRFMHQEFDVLVSTTIIENGVDIPSANTILVNRSDRYGLAQLYQLRGRVGRSNRRAFAYLLIPSDEPLTPIARRRLSAIREFSELGAGFRVAALDLELRGAGNLLGGEQHGHIEAIGFNLYCQMLERAVEELQAGESPIQIDTSINLGADLKLPTTFVPDDALRLKIYKEIASTKTEEEVDGQYRDLEDRFGELPVQVQNILEYARLRVLCRTLGIRSINRKRGAIDLVFHEQAKVEPERIVQLTLNSQEVAFAPPATIRIKMNEPYRDLFVSIQRVLRELY